MCKKIYFLISFVLVLALANSAFAQPETWPAAYWSGWGDDPCSWDDPNNWWTVDAYWDDVNYPTVPARIWAKVLPNAVPDADTFVMVGQGAPWYEYPAELASGGAVGYPVIDSGTALCYQIYISTGPNDTNGPGRLDVTGGTLTSRVYSDDWLGMMIGFVPDGTGVVNLSGGDILCDNYDGTGGLLAVGGWNYEDPDAGGGIGTLNMTGGTLTCYHMDCPESDSPDPCTSIGYINLHGGTFYTSADETWTEFWLGDAGMFPNSRIDITDGKAQITSHDENELYWINLWIDEGKITAYGGVSPRGELYRDYDITNPGYTTLSAWSPENDGQAWRPRPIRGATVDNLAPTLSWSPGDYAASHVVYFSTDNIAVENGTAPNTPRDVNNYVPPELLEFETVYYWRVDEVNDVCDPCLWPGAVWFFKTAGYDVVDDFESYADTTDLLATWVAKVVHGQPSLYVALETGEIDPGLVHLGGQSMYVNYWPNSSVARTFATSQDWTINDVEALTLYFRGTAGNPEAPMSVTLTNIITGPDTIATVVYDGDASDLSGEGWHEWNIRLQDFVDIESALDLTAIDKISIDFGAFTGESGVIYIDDIQLYPTRCIPDKAPFDIAGDDCITDYQELDVLTGDWLKKGYDIPAVPPSIDPNRLVRYTFDTEGGEGTVVHNSGSLAGDANGTFFDNYAHGPGGPLTWEDTGAPHPNATEPNYCIQLSAFDEQAVIMDCNFNDVVGGGFTTNHLTITCWIKRFGDQLEWTGLVFCSSPLPVDDPDPHAGLSLGANDDWMPETAPALNTLAYHWQTLDDACDATPDGEDQIWWWRSGLLVPDNQWTFCAVVVEPEQAAVYMMPAGGDLYKAVNIETHVPTTFEDPFDIGRDPRILWGSRTLNGQIDDVQIFDYALSESEILYVAQAGGAAHVGLVSLVDFDDSDNIDFFDYAILINHWLDYTTWP